MELLLCKKKNQFPIDIIPSTIEKRASLQKEVLGKLDGCAIPGILQARTLEWVATSFSNAWKWKVKGNSLSHVWLIATPWTAAYQAPPSMGFSRQEYWSGVPSLSPDKMPRGKAILILRFLENNCFWIEISTPVLFCHIYSERRSDIKCMYFYTCSQHFALDSPFHNYPYVFLVKRIIPK